MPSEVKWIKITTDIFDDEKIALIEAMPESDAVIVIWFKLLCLAGKQNNSGVFLLGDRMPYTDEMFASIFRRPLNTVRLALQTFQTYGMIEIIDNTVTIPKWGKYQTLDALEHLRMKNRERVRVYRARQKQLAEAKDDRCNVTLTLCNGGVTTSDIDKDKDINSNVYDDNSLTGLFQNAHIPMMPKFWELLRSYMEDGITVSMVRYAVEQAVKYNALSWGYIKKMLDDWSEAGYTSLEEVEGAERVYQGQRHGKDGKFIQKTPNPLDDVGFTT